MRVVYVHGFGGRVVDPKFADALRERGAQLQIRSPVVSYSWRSGWLNRNVTLPEWVEAKADAEKEAERLALAVSKDSTATHLVAFSLGCWLVLHALKDLRTVPDHLRSIFLLGAAVPYDYDLTDIGWYRDVLAINYYSPDIDFVLRRVYARIEGVPAAGVKGFLH